MNHRRPRTSMRCFNVGPDPLLQVWKSKSQNVRDSNRQHRQHNHQDAFTYPLTELALQFGASHKLTLEVLSAF